MGKKLAVSKIFWVNLIAGAVAVAGYISGYLGPEYQAILGAITAGLNILLRFVTKEPITGIV